MTSRIIDRCRIVTSLRLPGFTILAPRILRKLFCLTVRWYRMRPMSALRRWLPNRDRQKVAYCGQFGAVRLPVAAAPGRDNHSNFECCQAKRAHPEFNASAPAYTTSPSIFVRARRSDRVNQRDTITIIGPPCRVLSYFAVTPVLVSSLAAQHSSQQRMFIYHRLIVPDELAVTPELGRVLRVRFENWR